MLKKASFLVLALTAVAGCASQPVPPGRPAPLQPQVEQPLARVLIRADRDAREDLLALLTPALTAFEGATAFPRHEGGDSPAAQHVAEVLRELDPERESDELRAEVTRLRKGDQIWVRLRLWREASGRQPSPLSLTLVPREQRDTVIHPLPAEHASAVPVADEVVLDLETAPTEPAPGAGLERVGIAWPAAELTIDLRREDGLWVQHVRVGAVHYQVHAEAVGLLANDLQERLLPPIERQLGNRGLPVEAGLGPRESRNASLAGPTR